MTINRPIKMIAPVLAAGAVAFAVQTGVTSVAVGASGHSARAAHSEGDRNAMPPILPVWSASQLQPLEALEAVEFATDPPGTPANAPYSNADMNAYASANK